MSQAGQSLARDLLAHVRWLADCGVDELRPGRGLADPSSPEEAARQADSSSPGEAARKPDPSSPASGPAPVGRAAAATGAPISAPGGSAPDLGALRAEIGDCHRCRLAGGRTQIVFGVGNPSARLLFVGEGPGRDEDLAGEPFVGRAGELLTDIIQKGMNLDRADVYICNVVKCRPPGNRNPEPDEVAACSPFLIRQVELVRPEVIVALGKFAAQTLLQTSTPIARLRGRWHEYHGIPLMPTFHPAHLLRNPGYKRQVWEDIKQVMARLGLPGA